MSQFSAAGDEPGGPPVIKHIVVWRLKESAHGNNKRANALLIKQRLEALNGKIPGLRLLKKPDPWSPIRQDW